MRSSKSPKILIFDVETAPNLGYIWGKYEQNVIAYKEEWRLLSVAYKWVGEKTIRAISTQGKKTDKELVVQLHNLFNEADILVAHNGDSFDIKKVTARMVYHKMKPPKVLTSVDTKKVAKRYFNFNGNGLEDLGVFLGLGKKYKHSGFDMWLGCMNDEAASWKEMIYYNKKDVLLLEKVYQRFLPWIQNHPNIAKLLNPQENRRGICPKCGSTHVEKRGYRATQSSIRQQWVCKDCDSWFLTAVEKK